MHSFSCWMEPFKPYYTQKSGFRLYPGPLDIHWAALTACLKNKKKVRVT